MQPNAERPRELRWYQAGPMLFGDWGTSRLYVLGLALAFNGRAAPWFIAAMCVLMLGVGRSYQAVCRLYPDGGGVYASTKGQSQLLAVIGALLLCADYVVTASLSCLDAFHYLDAVTGLGDEKWFGLPNAAVLASATIGLVGALNLFGPRRSGTVAMVIALATVALTLVIGARAALHLTGLWPAEGAGPIDVEAPWHRGPWANWVGFTQIVLALSGVEAIANMTGIMVEPVDRTSRRAIRPVLLEIVALNLLLSIAMVALPDAALYGDGGSGSGSAKPAHTDDMLRVIASAYVGPIFATVSAVVFAALLLSALNTALGALVSIQFNLAKDGELPRIFSSLNRFGMPLVPLLVATAAPIVVVLLFPDVESLAGLYAIGVVGAIMINLGSTSIGRSRDLGRVELILMRTLTVVMAALGLTICVIKPEARAFAMLVLILGLSARLATIATNPDSRLPDRPAHWMLALSIVASVAEVALVATLGVGLWSFAGSAVLAASVVAASVRLARICSAGGGPTGKAPCSPDDAPEGSEADDE